MTVLEQNAYNAIIAMAKKDEPDYWTRLEHQAAIAAMQGILSNEAFISTSPVEIKAELAAICEELAHALVGKMKEDKA